MRRGHDLRSHGLDIECLVLVLYLGVETLSVSHLRFVFDTFSENGHEAFNGPQGPAFRSADSTKTVQPFSNS